MRAAVVRRHGPPSVLAVEDGYPLPQRAPGEVLVEVHASGVNPVDCKARSGEIPGIMNPVPRVSGRDFAGLVVAADPGSAMAPGIRVWGFTDWSWGPQMLRRAGSAAEFISVPENCLSRAPARLAWEQAAALPLVASTAWQALEGLAGGQRVLIQAGAGGLGSAAIQLAKARGLHVTTTCSTRNLAFVKELGADEAVDYTKDSFDEVYRQAPFDAVIDCLGGDCERRSLAVTKRSGAYIQVANSGLVIKHGRWLGYGLMVLNLLKGKLLHMLGLGPRYTMVFVQPQRAQLESLAGLVEAGKLRPIIDQVFPLERISEAHKYVEGGHTRGKVVLRVREG